ncbi:MAG: DUF4097 family beta strand repeat-containing protein [Propionibacteriaceae bacterium]
MTPRRLRLAAILSAAALAVTASSCGILRTTSTDEATLDETVNSIQFDLDSSSVTVTTGEETKVSRTIRHAGELPGATHSVTDGVLTLDHCEQTGCEIDYAVVVGPDTKVQGTTGSGEISITGVAAAVTEADSGATHLADLASTAEARTGSGDVTLERIGGGTTVHVDSGAVQVAGVGAGLEVESSSGDITASSISGDVLATSSSGAIDVSLALPANLRATAKSGDVTVTVPKGPYRVNAEADSGDVTDDLSSDDSAEFAVEARTDSGNIHLRSA